MTIPSQIRPFSQLIKYDQDEPGEATFHWVLENNEIPDVCMGLVTLKGPIHKTPATHDEFDQVYLVFSGTATVHLDDRDIRITEPSAVIIPAGTHHSVELQLDETLQYVFVNRWRKDVS